MRHGGGRFRWWEVIAVTWLLAVGLVAVGPGEANTAAALVCGGIGGAVYGAVTRLFAP